MADLFKVNTNISALRALSTLQDINTKIVETQERISTGKQVNRASDDPSTFFISRLFETSISALVANQIEVERGIDFLETNNTRLDQAADIIIEITDLVNTANSGSITSAEQQAISREIALLVEQIDTILNSGVSAKLFTGFSIGALNDVSISGGLITTTTLNILNSDLVTTGTTTQFTTAINNLSSALTTILEAEETVGAWVSRLEFELDDLSATEIADRASLSTIIDADLAEQQVALSSLQILQQTSLVGLMQANSAPNAILGLIQGA
jgi:flagellin